MRNDFGNFTAPKLRRVFGGRNILVDKIVPPIKIYSGGRQELLNCILSRFPHDDAVAEGYDHKVVCRSTGTVKVDF